jgi:hypothetical protein
MTSSSLNLVGTVLNSSADVIRFRDDVLRIENAAKNKPLCVGNGIIAGWMCLKTFA